MCKLEPELDLVLTSDWFKLYRAKSLDDKQSFLLRVPTDPCWNGEINLEAELLAHYVACCEDIETRYSKAKNNPAARVHYDWLLPQLSMTFITDESQGNRQVNLLTVRDANVEDFIPMAKLVEKYKVDARTAAWILGRLYKLQSFLEDYGGPYNFNVDGVILEPRMHRLVYLGIIRSGEWCDWHTSLRNATTAIHDWVELNGTVHEKDFLEWLEWAGTEDYYSYQDATETHKMFYAKLDEWWGHKYHPFTYMERETGAWHTIKNAPKL